MRDGKVGVVDYNARTKFEVSEIGVKSAWDLSERSGRRSTAKSIGSPSGRDLGGGLRGSHEVRRDLSAQRRQVAESERHLTDLPTQVLVAGHRSLAAPDGDRADRPRGSCRAFRGAVRWD
jgi:hypothetical protein